jgi:hypothetical protein
VCRPDSGIVGCDAYIDSFLFVDQTQGMDEEWTDDENHEDLTIYEGKRRNRITDEEFMKNLVRYPTQHIG